MKKALLSFLIFSTIHIKGEVASPEQSYIPKQSECENKCENEHFWNWKNISLITSTFIVSAVTLILVGNENSK
ncbi:MAG: hypothetical protein FJZ57_05135 [Chlamydiae bacterium]|nr:hypothetical protein [Chlamydiota bacterium]